MTKKHIGLIIVLITLGIGIFAYQSLRPAADETPRIVVVLPSDRNPFWIDVRRGAEQAAEELGSTAVITITASNDQDATSQNSILDNYFSRRKTDALVIGPANDHVIVPKVANFLRAGIPVVVIDTELNSEALAEEDVEPPPFIGSSNKDGGEKAAREMARALIERGYPKKVLLIQGSFVHQSAIDRTNGFLEVATELGIEVEQVKGEWKRDRAQELVATRFSRDSSFGGIFANNDDMALGGVAALKGLNIDVGEWPIVIGFDATGIALEAIANGEMHATVRQDATAMGKEGVMSALKALTQGALIEERRLLGVKVVLEQ